MRVQRSLTLKQMTTVSAVAVLVICIFVLLQMFHFVQQRRVEYVQQLESIAGSVRAPLSVAVLNGDLPATQMILSRLRPIGILGQATIASPAHQNLLQVNFNNDPPMPAWRSWLFCLPVKVTVPLYPLAEEGRTAPLGWLTLTTSPGRDDQFVRSAFSTMVMTYLLLALVLSIAVSWFINRLMVHPLRNICKQLQNFGTASGSSDRLVLPAGHDDDEIGVLVRSINQNRALLTSVNNEVERLNTRFRLTDLPNRTLFLALLEQFLTQKNKHRQISIMVMRVCLVPDILQPKSSETFQMLMARKIRRFSEEGSVTGQLSATEFMMFCDGVTQPLQMMRHAEQLMKELTQVLTLQEVPVRPTVSIGLARMEKGEASAAELLDRGISAMHSASQEGINQIMFFDPQMTERARQRMAQYQDILQGIHNKEYALYIQPQVDMNSGQLVGAEALLRIRREDGRYTLPQEFITTAEDIGVMPEIGRWVFEEACRILSVWQSQGITLPLSVNTSALQLQDPSMVSHLQNLLSSLKIIPGTFVLELTETAQIADTERAMELLRPIEETGVSVVLDDFGMGYSNLNYLHQFRSLPVRRLKLDRGFVSGLPADDTMVRVVSSIAGIMKLDVVAEGVETEEQRDWLIARGIHIAQGYLYSPALSEQQFAQQWLPKIAN